MCLYILCPCCWCHFVRGREWLSYLGLGLGLALGLRLKGVWGFRVTLCLILLINAGNVVAASGHVKGELCFWYPLCCFCCWVWAPTCFFWTMFWSLVESLTCRTYSEVKMKMLKRRETSQGTLLLHGCIQHLLAWLILLPPHSPFRRP